MTELQAQKKGYVKHGSGNFSSFEKEKATAFARTLQDAGFDSCVVLNIKTQSFFVYWRGRKASFNDIPVQKKKPQQPYVNPTVSCLNMLIRAMEKEFVKPSLPSLPKDPKEAYQMGLQYSLSVLQLTLSFVENGLKKITNKKEGI